MKKKKKWTVTCEAVYVEMSYEEWLQPFYEFSLPILESLVDDAMVQAAIEEWLAMPVVEESLGNFPKL